MSILESLAKACQLVLYDFEPLARCADQHVACQARLLSIYKTEEATAGAQHLLLLLRSCKWKEALFGMLSVDLHSGRGCAPAWRRANL